MASAMTDEEEYTGIRYLHINHEVVQIFTSQITLNSGRWLMGIPGEILESKDNSSLLCINAHARPSLWSPTLDHGATSAEAVNGSCPTIISDYGSSSSKSSTESNCDEETVGTTQNLQGTPRYLNYLTGYTPDVSSRFDMATMRDVPQSSSLSDDLESIYSISDILEVKVDGEAEEEEEENIIAIVLASLRGDPSVTPSVRDLLHRESEAFRRIALGNRNVTGAAPRKSTGTSRLVSSKDSRISKQSEKMPSGRKSSRPKVKLAPYEYGGVYAKRFACPFHKVQPMIYCFHAELGGTGDLYSTCSGPGFNDIRRVEDHVRTIHGRPQCLNCLLICASIEALDQHGETGGCLREPDRAKKEPVSDAVWERIIQSRTTQAEWTEHVQQITFTEYSWNKDETQWFKIFDICLPGIEPLSRPRSPYLGEGENPPSIVMLRGSLHDIQASTEVAGDLDTTSILHDTIRAIEEIITRAGPTLQRLYDRRIARILDVASRNTIADLPAPAAGPNEFDRPEYHGSVLTPEQQLLAATPQIRGMRAPSVDNPQSGYDFTNAVELLPLPSPASEASLDMESFDLG